MVKTWSHPHVPTTFNNNTLDLISLKKFLIVQDDLRSSQTKRERSFAVNENRSFRSNETALLQEIRSKSPPRPDFSALKMSSDSVKSTTALKEPETQAANDAITNSNTNFSDEHQNNNTTIEVQRSKSPPPISTEDLRNKVLQEILSTEKFYLKKMKLVVSVVREQLTQQKIASQQQIDKIFLGIDDIISLSNEFVNVLEKKLSHSDSIGEIFLDLAPSIRPTYAKNVENHWETLVTLDELEKKDSYVTFMEQIFPQMEGLNLRAYLIMPCQRIPRFDLFDISDFFFRLTRFLFFFSRLFFFFFADMFCCSKNFVKKKNQILFKF